MSAIGSTLGALGATLGGASLLNTLSKTNQGDIFGRVIGTPTFPAEMLSKDFDIPIKVVPGFSNAMYVKPKKLNKNQISALLKKVEYLKNKKKRVDAGALQGSIEMAQKPKGGVVAGQHFLNPTIIAHEKGHQEDSSPLSSVAPKVEKLWKDYKLDIIGSLGAIALGQMYPKYRNAFHLGNLGVQAASTVPILYSEWSASDTAKKLHPLVDTKLLDDTYRSYMYSTLGNRLAVPSLAIAGAYLGERAL